MIPGDALEKKRLPRPTVYRLNPILESDRQLENLITAFRALQFGETGFSKQGGTFSAQCAG